MKKVHLSLDETSIAKAIEEIEVYKEVLVSKINRFLLRVGEILREEAQEGFDGAILDDLVEGSPKRPDVTVEVVQSLDKILVIAQGEDAIWVEFGTGVFHNEVLGASPHPKGAELGFTIGGYGKGLGEKEIWGFYDEGSLKLTYGTPASMPMYKATMAVSERINKLAREVFG